MSSGCPGCGTDTGGGSSGGRPGWPGIILGIIVSLPILGLLIKACS